MMKNDRRRAGSGFESSASGFAARFHYDGYRRVHGVPVDVVGVTSRAPAATLKRSASVVRA